MEKGRRIAFKDLMEPEPLPPEENDDELLFGEAAGVGAAAAAAAPQAQRPGPTSPVRRPADRFNFGVLADLDGQSGSEDGHSDGGLSATQFPALAMQSPAQKAAVRTLQALKSGGALGASAGGAGPVCLCLYMKGSHAVQCCVFDLRSAV